MKSSREKFEEWWATYVDKCAHPVEDVEYYAAKEAWRASRAAIEIELPAVIWDMSEDGSQHYDRDEMIYAIQSVGIKVKA